MKLLHYTSSWLALILFLILTLWATAFYFDMLDEIYDSMDDGLENQKLLVIRKAEKEGVVPLRDDFDDGYYTIREVPFQQVENFKDSYQDTLIYTLNEEDLEPFRMLKTAFQQDDEYYEMKVITSMVEEDDLIQHLLFALIVLYLGLMSSIIVLNNYMLKTIWKPFYFLVERLKTFRLDDPKPLKVPKTKIVEFRLLNESVTKLLQRNVQIFNSQKQFIENASHELQTPLAISMNKLELLVEHHTPDEEELLIISSVMDNLERLSRLNKALLLLSKIGNNQFSGLSEIDFNQLILKQADDFSDLAAHQNVDVSVKVVGPCVQRMNPDLAGIVITNLLKNAIIHNHSGGWVNIFVKKNSILIENSGKGSQLESDKMFSRFQKGQNSPHSNGLGLSIVKAITELYGFTIRYAYQEKHIMEIIF